MIIQMNTSFVHRLQLLATSFFDAIPPLVWCILPVSVNTFEQFFFVFNEVIEVTSHKVFGALRQVISLTIAFMFCSLDKRNVP